MTISRKTTKKNILRIRIVARKYPAIFYIIKWFLFSLLIGGCIGTASAFFLQSLDWVTNIREENKWILALLPFAGLAIGLLFHYFGKEVESGNNLLIDTIHNTKKIIPFKMTPLVLIGTLTTHLFGGSAGREGTAIQMAGSIADQFSKPLQLKENDRKILIIAAIAAGFGSVFGTPIAGAIFGLEVFLIGKIKYEAIFPAFAASIIADMVTKSWNIHHTQYHIVQVPSTTVLNISYAIISGIAFGICAAIFSKLIHKVTKAFKNNITFPPLRSMIGGVIVASGVLLIGTTKYIGLGIPTIVASFQQQVQICDAAIKMAFTIITLSAGFKGGEVTPLFFIGAVLGNAISIFIPLPMSLLAGMGFVAVFAGATNTPLASTIMAMELFGSECAVFVAIACVVSYLLSGHNSIYGNQKIGTAKHILKAHYEEKRINEL